MVSPLFSQIGHQGREFLLHLRRWGSKPAAKKVVIFPYSTRAVGSSNLRAWLLGEELNRLGWRAVVVPPQLELHQRLRVLRGEDPSIVILQKARHPLNRPALYRPYPVVFDLDDADYEHPDQLGAVRECCEQSQAVIAGSQRLVDWCRRHNPRTSLVWTGTPIPPRRPSLRSAQRRPVLAWAHSSPSRMKAEGAFVLEVLRRVRPRSEFEFRLYGVDDERDVRWLLDPLRTLSIPVRCHPYMRYDRFLHSLEEVSVGLHPVCADDPFSQGKSFGKILAYLSADVAIVTHDANDHGLVFTHGVHAVLANAAESWAEGILDLLGDPGKRERMVDAAREQFERHLSLPVAAAKVSDVLLQASTPQPTPS